MIVFGAGGHGKVVVDALLAQGVDLTEIVVWDSDPAKGAGLLLGSRVVTDFHDQEAAGTSFHAAIGNSLARASVTARLQGTGGRPASVIHPAAIVSRFATIGDGSFVGAGALIGPSAAIGAGVIVNHGAVVDHDCKVGDFCHIAPNVTLGGGVHVGDQSLIGSGAVILPTVVVGPGAVIGSGAVVTRNVPEGEIWLGVPAARSN